MTIRIVTDSACDLPQHLVDQHGIGIVPLSFRFGD
ncbi:MAG: DegV family protein, partial [Ilumatobacteraceae bacterium]